MKPNYHAVAAIVFGLIVQSALVHADPVRIDFDTDLAGNALASGTLLNDAYPSDWFRFGSDDQIIRTGDGVPSLPNFARGGNNGFTEPIDLFFLRPVASIGASNVSSSDWTLLAFGSADDLLGSVSIRDFPASGLLRFPGGIHRARFIHSPTATSAGFGVDDLIFDASPVPEPASILLFATGAAGLCAQRLRRRRAQG